MYDQDKIKDSLDFVDQIRIYEECNSESIFETPSVSPESKKNRFDLSGYLPDKTEYPIETTEKAVRSFMGDVLYILICVIISVTVAYVITHYVAHHTMVDGNSMNSTLQDKDYLIIERMSYYFHEPERFDIIVFPYSDDVNYIKRIIGLPGEKLQIIDGKVYINDNQLYDDIYGNAIINDAGMASSPIYLGEDEFFVMGDNRNSSNDSRKTTVGPIKRDRIDGKAVFRFWPLDSIGTLK